MPPVELPIPINIPWKLASTTQYLKEGNPDPTTISLFFYEPSIENLETDYPDERLIYFKVTASISPYFTNEETYEALREVPRNILLGGKPIIHLILDLQVSPQHAAALSENVIRPYFHDAAPIRRSMVETGVIGNSFFEGENNSIAMGKSASQIFENVTSLVDSTNISTQTGLGCNGSITGVGSSASISSNSGSRLVNQHSESTNRDASVERRELLSYSTNVKNILSLLNVKHIGSPFLRFGMSPRPLRQLSINPSDPNLWYNQLIERRSKGIEGVQDFLAIVAVPRDMPFCFNATLRRFCVIDKLPKYQDIYDSNGGNKTLVILSHLLSTYPPGMPIDQLDIDVTDDFENLDRIPVVKAWGHPTEDAIIGLAEYPSDTNGNVNHRRFKYKTRNEIFRDAVNQKYLIELTKSPLERGVAIERRINFRTCFARNREGELAASDFSNIVLPDEAISVMPEIQYSPSEIVGNISMYLFAEYSAIVTHWNSLQIQFEKNIANMPDYARRPLALNHPKIVELLITDWSQLNEKDAKNFPLDTISSFFQIPPEILKKLKKAGVKNIKELSNLMLITPEVERYNENLSQFLASVDEKQKSNLDLNTLNAIQHILSIEDIAKIFEVIGKALSNNKSSSSRKLKN